MKILVIGLAALLAAPSLQARDPLDAPLAIRNTGPIANLYGLPRNQGGHVEDRLAWSMVADYGNSFTGSGTGANQVELDGETAVTSLTLRAPITQGWEWGAEIPYVSHRDSDLDSFIDEFHELFGFPDAGRNRVPRGLLNYLVRVDGETHARITEPESGMGDVRVWVGRSLYADTSKSGALRLQVKAPTGDVEDLTGSGATDVALWWEHDQRALFGWPRLSLSTLLGAAWLGEGDLAPRRQEDLVGLASLGLRFRLTDRVQFNLQADAHGAPIGSEVDELGEDGFLGTIGGRIVFTESLWLDLAVVENLNAESAPDAVFLLHLSGRW